MPSLVLTIKSPRTDLATRLTRVEPREALLNLSKFIRGYATGLETGAVYAQNNASDPVAASATATLVSCATDTITIGGITFTGTGTPTTELHFETDGNDAADAAALAAAINAHSTLSKIVVATTASNNIVTITCLVKGVIGNFITLSETGTTITVSGAALAGGTGGPTGSPTSYILG